MMDSEIVNDHLLEKLVASQPSVLLLKYLSGFYVRDYILLKLTTVTNELEPDVLSLFVHNDSVVHYK